MKQLWSGRRVLALVLALALMLCLPGCAGKSGADPGSTGTGSAGMSSADSAQPPQDGRLRVVTTLFPYYDFVRQIAGEQVDLTLVVPAGMDSHSFEPTPADMRTIQQADLLICNGGAMEHWLSQVLGAMDTSDMTVVTMMDYVDAVEEELVEGMEVTGHEHGHGEAAADDAGGHAHGKTAGEPADKTLADEADDDSYIDHDGHEHEIEYDEHIWTSPVNAMKLAAAVRDALCGADPAHRELYMENAAAYQKELERIDAGLRQVSENRKRNMIILGDKFPFRYLAEEYRLDYRAAFSGCSTDTEPSARTIAYLVDKVREEKIPVVYYLELSSHRVAEIIGEETGAEPLLLHSCHNVTRAQFDAGVTYVELMEQNIENLRKGLDQ